MLTRPGKHCGSFDLQVSLLLLLPHYLVGAGAPAGARQVILWCCSCLQLWLMGLKGHLLGLAAALPRPCICHGPAEFSQLIVPLAALSGTDSVTLALQVAESVHKTHAGVSC